MKIRMMQHIPKLILSYLDNKTCLVTCMMVNSTWNKFVSGHHAIFLKRIHRIYPSSVDVTWNNLFAEILQSGDDKSAKIVWESWMSPDRTFETPLSLAFKENHSPLLSIVLKFDKSLEYWKNNWWILNKRW